MVTAWQLPPDPRSLVFPPPLCGPDPRCPPQGAACEPAVPGRGRTWQVRPGAVGGPGGAPPSPWPPPSVTVQAAQPPSVSIKNSRACRSTSRASGWRGLWLHDICWFDVIKNQGGHFVRPRLPQLPLCVSDVTETRVRPPVWSAAASVVPVGAVVWGLSPASQRPPQALSSALRRHPALLTSA